MVKTASDADVLAFLESHTYKETMDRFDISRMTIARIKKRNANERKSDYMPEKIQLAIVGLGNAASAVVQGIEFYKNAKKPTGLLRPTLAGYHISDIQVVAAFDIASAKVGKTVGKAIKENELAI